MRKLESEGSLQIKQCLLLPVTSISSFLSRDLKKLPSWEPSKADIGVETSPVLAIVATAPQGTVVAVPRAGLTGLSPLPRRHSRAPAPSDQHPQ